MPREQLKQKSLVRRLFLISLIVLGTAIIAISCIFALNSRSTQTPEPPTDFVQPQQLPLHSYDWARLTTDENGRKQYTDENGNTALLGIDVSKYQGEIDWNAVAQDGISYAIIRAGHRGYHSGEIAIDATFHDNLKKADEAGISVGVYFFSQAITVQEAIDEANSVLEAIEGYNVTYPIAFDFEQVHEPDARTENLDHQMRTDMAVAFCEQIKSAGYTPMIYSSRAYLTDYFYLNQILDYDIWVAEYAEHPDFPYSFTMWQFSRRGRVAGIAPDVDLNLCFKNYAE